jgi:hypothetical protein
VEGSTDGSREGWVDGSVLEGASTERAAAIVGSSVVSLEGATEGSTDGSVEGWMDG